MPPAIYSSFFAQKTNWDWLTIYRKSRLCSVQWADNKFFCTWWCPCSLKSDFWLSNVTFQMSVTSWHPNQITDIRGHQCVSLVRVGWQRNVEGHTDWKIFGLIFPSPSYLILHIILLLQAFQFLRCKWTRTLVYPLEETALTLSYRLGPWHSVQGLGILILKYLERISDHACYVGDSVNYIVTGTSRPRRWVAKNLSFMAAMTWRVTLSYNT